jgi:DNA repair protein RecN (Recombination protein N)
MLQHLSIQHFTIIDNLELEFKAGMTVLTGETGAGKSILIDALMLALGGRGDSNAIRQGQERCTISANFNIQKQPIAKQWLAEHELTSDDECVLRRIITSDGRSRAFINGQATTLQQLRELGSLLVSIHGQHEHQTLLKPDKQRLLLDAYAGHTALVKKVQTLYYQWRSAQDELATLQAQAEQRQARQELLAYQTQELAKLNLQENEIKELDIEQRQLANADRLLNSCQQLLNILAEQDEGNVLTLLNNAQAQLGNLQNIDQQFNVINELLNNAEIQINEAISELRHYFAGVELNPERLEWVEQRLSAIHEFARKHRTHPDELLPLQQRLLNELKQLENSDLAISELQRKTVELSQAYQAAAQELSHSRAQAAAQLSPLIENSMQQLNMPGGRFSVQFTNNPDKLPASYGLEKIEFLVSTNPGQALQPLAKIVSGGELSRISLAIQVLTAQTDTTPTLIFDEVDVGIGGGTAEIVGRLLRKLAKTTQVLCVTHLAQVAAQSQQHFQISKSTAENITQTFVRNLTQTDKIQEIARMLGGVKITKQTLAHAKEMLGIE